MLILLAMLLVPTLAFAQAAPPSKCADQLDTMAHYSGLVKLDRDRKEARIAELEKELADAKKALDAAKKATDKPAEAPKP